MDKDSFFSIFYADGPFVTNNLPFFKLQCIVDRLLCELVGNNGIHIAVLMIDDRLRCSLLDYTRIQSYDDWPNFEVFNQNR